jgi:hypothetical protein
MIDDVPLGQSSRSDFVKQLEEGTNFLDTQRDDIVSLWDQTPGIEIVSFYETKTTAVVTKVRIHTSHYTLYKSITDSGLVFFR